MKKTGTGATKKTITAELIKKKFQGEDEKAFTFCNLIEYHNLKMKGVLAEGTLKNYFTTQKYLEEFLKAHYRSKDKPLSELSYSFLTEFEHFLRNHKPLSSPTIK